MLLLLGLVCRFACFALLRVSRLSVRVGLLSAHLLSKKLSPRRDGLTCQTTRLAQDTGARPQPASARGDAPARRAGWGVRAVRHQQRPGAARAAKKAGPPATRTVRTTRTAIWNFGQWGGAWRRGPDPLHEFDAFATRVLALLSGAAALPDAARLLRLPLCELLLDQRLFNG